MQSQLYRAMDCQYITKEQFDEIYELASECRKQIKGFRKYLRSYDRDWGIEGLRDLGIEELKDYEL